MSQLTTKEREALTSWAKLNEFLRKPIKLKILESMLAHECISKKRTNVIIRLNNKIYTLLREKNLKELLKRK